MKSLTMYFQREQMAVVALSYDALGLERPSPLQVLTSWCAHMRGSGVSWVEGGKFNMHTQLNLACSLNATGVLLVCFGRSLARLPLRSTPASLRFPPAWLTHPGGCRAESSAPAAHKRGFWPPGGWEGGVYSLLGGWDLDCCQPAREQTDTWISFLAIAS